MLGVETLVQEIVGMAESSVVEVDMTDPTPIGPNFDKQYRDYVLQNVARTVRAEMLEELARGYEIAELERMWGEEQ